MEAINGVISNHKGCFLKYPALAVTTEIGMGKGRIEPATDPDADSDLIFSMVIAGSDIESKDL